MKKTKKENNKRRQIIDWATEHNLVINPSKGMEVYVQNILTFGYCPCDSNRPDCPCPESISDVAEKGHCLCRLYWKDLDTFMATLKAGREKNEEGTL